MFPAPSKDLALTEADMSCGHAGRQRPRVLFCKVRRPPRSATESSRSGSGSGGGDFRWHGIGRAKANYFVELEDRPRLALLRRIKDSFDPAGSSTPVWCSRSPERFSCSSWDPARRKALAAPRADAMKDVHAARSESTSRLAQVGSGVANRRLGQLENRAVRPRSLRRRPS